VADFEDIMVSEYLRITGHWSLQFVQLPISSNFPVSPKLEYSRETVAVFFAIVLWLQASDYGVSAPRVEILLVLILRMLQAIMDSARRAIIEFPTSQLLPSVASTWTMSLMLRRFGLHSAPMLRHGRLYLGIVSK